MNELYNETSALLQTICPGLASLERANDDEEADKVYHNLSASLDTVASNCDRLDILANKEPPGKRTNAQYRVRQLKYDSQHLRSSLQSVVTKREQRKRYEDEHSQLMSRRYTANADTTVNFDEMGRMENVHSQVDDLLSTGRMSLNSMRDQFGSLQGVKRKMVEVLNTMGLSNTVMRLIERRTTEDKYILFGGMIVTLVIMYCLYAILRGGTRPITAEFDSVGI